MIDQRKIVINLKNSVSHYSKTNYKGMYCFNLVKDLKHDFKLVKYSWYKEKLYDYVERLIAANHLPAATNEKLSSILDEWLALV